MQTWQKPFFSLPCAEGRKVETFTLCCVLGSFLAEGERGWWGLVVKVLSKARQRAHVGQSLQWSAMRSIALWETQLELLPVTEITGC